MFLFNEKYNYEEVYQDRKKYIVSIPNKNNSVLFSVYLATRVVFTALIRNSSTISIAIIKIQTNRKEIPIVAYNFVLHLKYKQDMKPTV